MNAPAEEAAAELPAPFLPDAPPLGGADLDDLRLLFAIAIYVLVLAGILYYMLRKLPRQGTPEGRP